MILLNCTNAFNLVKADATTAPPHCEPVHEKKKSRFKSVATAFLPRLHLLGDSEDLDP